jgi:hypothetical protein
VSVFASAASGILTAAVRFAEEEPDFDPNTVTPGVIGFIATFLVAAAIVLLVFDMNRRIRRTRYREEIREKLAQERAAADGTGDPESPAPKGDDAGSYTP